MPENLNITKLKTTFNIFYQSHTKFWPLNLTFDITDLDKMSSFRTLNTDLAVKLKSITSMNQPRLKLVSMAWLSHAMLVSKDLTTELGTLA